MKANLKEFWYYFSQNRGAVVGLLVIALFVLSAILAPVVAPMSPTEVSDAAVNLPPAWTVNGQTTHLLGTDDLGRDLLSRLMYGAQVSLGIGFFTVILSMFVGVFLGLIAGSVGGWVDSVIMRANDILMALPSILLAIVVVSILGPNLANTIVAVAVVSIPSFVRLTRAQVQAEMSKNYVAASRIFGASWFRVVVINVLPNCMAPLIVQATMGFSEAILNAAALGFLGLGAQPPMPEWGTMLSDARSFIETAPWLVTLPGICILVVVLGFNLLGDGLRDAFDPKLRR
ncbi:MAG: ABC transporter permease [Pseudobdellovibrionaceae bacterium]